MTIRPQFSLPTIPYNDTNQQLNNSGQIVWQGDVDGDIKIFFYDGTTITQLTDNTFQNGSPQINDNGQMVWDQDTGTNDFEIIFYDGSSITQITNNTTTNDWPPHINNNGDIVWEGFINGAGWEIFLYKDTIVQLYHRNVGHILLSDRFPRQRYLYQCHLA